MNEKYTSHEKRYLDMDMNTYCALLPEAVAQIGNGAFLTAGGDIVNPMTIGWAQFGVVWGKPMATVFVRKSRFTFDLLEDADLFHISVPAPDTMKAALAYCGIHSGREGDKLAAAGLTALPSAIGGASGIAHCDTHFECRIVYRQDMTLDALDAKLRARYYGANQALSNGDPHTVFVGEVLAAYRE